MFILQGIVYHGGNKMKKICLAVVFSVLLISINARADMHGEFVRVECNKTLGFFEIREETIYGEQANDFFAEDDSYIKYSSDNDKFKTEVYWVNSWAHTEEPFIYRCQISDTLAYDIEIKTMDRGDCEYTANSLVNITEISDNVESGESKEQKFVENVLMGCEGKIDRILWSYHRRDKKIYGTIFEGNNFWIEIDEQVDKPITNESIIQQEAKNKIYFEELEKREQERKIKERRI